MCEKPNFLSKLCSIPSVSVSLLFLVALVVRLPNFNESLWYDEVWYTFIRLNSTFVKQVLFHDVHPPFYPLLMKGWIELFGDSEISVRLPSLLFGLASLGVIFALVRTWFNSHTALLATVLMALSPVHIWYSQEAKNNMLLLLLTLLTVYGLQRAWANDGWKNWLLFITAAILALWTNHFSLWVIVSTFLWLWLQVLRKHGHKPLKWAVISTLLVVVAYLPVALSTLLQVNSIGRGYLRPFTIAEVYKLILIYLSHGNTIRTVLPWAPIDMLGKQPLGFFLVEIFFAFLLCSGLVAVGHHWLTRRTKPHAEQFPKGNNSELLLLYFWVPPILLLLASFFYPKIYVERSMIIMLPPFMILLAYGVMTFGGFWWRCILLAGLLFLNCWSLFNLCYAKAEVWTVWLPNPDWRAFANDIRNDMTGTLVFTNCKPLAVRHYLKDLESWATEMRVPPNLSAKNLRAYIREEFKNRRVQNPRFFYIAINKYWDTSPTRLMNYRLIRRMYHLVERKNYKALEVYKYSLYPL